MALAHGSPAYEASYSFEIDLLRADPLVRRDEVGGPRYVDAIRLRSPELIRPAPRWRTLVTSRDQKTWLVATTLARMLLERGHGLQLRSQAPKSRPRLISRVALQRHCGGRFTGRVGASAGSGVRSRVFASRSERTACSVAGPRGAYRDPTTTRHTSRLWRRPRLSPAQISTCVWRRALNWSRWANRGVRDDCGRLCSSKRAAPARTRIGRFLPRLVRL
jgi:hypothetical protein